MHVFGLWEEAEVPRDWKNAERPQPADGFGLKNVLLWRDSVNHCNTVPPTVII